MSWRQVRSDGFWHFVMCVAATPVVALVAIVFTRFQAPELLVWYGAGATLLTPDALEQEGPNWFEGVLRTVRPKPLGRWLCAAYRGWLWPIAMTLPHGRHRRPGPGHIFGGPIAYAYVMGWAAGWTLVPVCTILVFGAFVGLQIAYERGFGRHRWLALAATVAILVAGTWYALASPNAEPIAGLWLAHAVHVATEPLCKWLSERS